ncbi:uncharacterized protein LOC107262880 [Cephus cinctus]|uniref:Uncharacterized protein LOC107262880 n=1 Tax=Cephus cinctus TaxID=211228 RepID=A0AAJ7BFR4_CEPCN|nr:uncharacterized protein LOC107262880 [Cephus cinctus]
MQYLLIAIIGTTIVGMSYSSTVDYSNSVPYNILYTVYPWYESGAVLEVWANDESSNADKNLATIIQNNQEGTNVLYPEKTNIHNETNHLNNANDAQRLSHSLLWPANYRNWPKKSNNDEN